jgi:OFA family oxalate/formate antiporter-like MFS transporter
MNTNATTVVLAPAKSTILDNRWLQLCCGILCMAMVSNMQYGWTLFTNPMSAKMGWTLVQIQVAFTIMIISQTTAMPVQGYLIDRFGPRPVVMAAGIFTGASWLIDANASSLPMLYFGAVFGGLGMGGVVAACSGNLLKWFPDRLGLAAGLVAMGFGLGSAAFINPMINAIKTGSYENTFLTFGTLFGTTIFLISWLMRSPPNGNGNAAALGGRRSYTPTEVLRTWPFWMMYVAFICVGAGGLMVIAQIAPMAKDMQLDEFPVTLVGVTLPALVFAMWIDRVLNGVTRPFFGWVSDVIGRENTMFIAFSLEAAGIVALAMTGNHPVAFVLLTGLVFFAWGEIFSLFPATVSDIYGPRYNSTNVCLLQTALGVAASVVPLANVVKNMTGSWDMVFFIAAGMNVVAAVMGLLLKPARARLKKHS